MLPAEYGAAMADLLEMEPSGNRERELSAADKAWLEDCFLYHAPNSCQKDKLYEVTAAAREFAEAILRNVPPSADRSTALRLVRESRMWANAAIVMEGRR